MTSSTSRSLFTFAFAFLLLALGASSPGRAQVELEGHSVFELGTRANRGRLGDFNEDGLLDLASINTFEEELTVVTGDGLAGDREVAFLDSTSLTFNPRAIAKADFNRDGHLDLAVVRTRSRNVGEGRVTIFLGDGTGRFSVFQHVAAGASPILVVPGDFDDDGFLDLIVGSELGPRMDLEILFGDGFGTFSPGPSVPDTGGALNVRVGDLDDNGRDDLVVQISSDLHILLGSGAGTFTPAPSIPLIRALTETDGALAVGDLDEDGHQDVVVGVGAQTSRAQVFLGDGTGMFSSGPINHLPTIRGIFRLVLGDWNRDGHLDAVVHGDRTFAHLRGNGRGNLNLRSQSRSLDEEPQLFAGDMDADGWLDAVIVGEDDTRALVVLGDGTGDLVLTQEFATGSETFDGCLSAVDLDRDGNLDLITDERFDGVRVLLGEASGGFEDPVVSLFPESVRDLRTGDFDEDGELDVVGSSRQSLLFGPGDGQGAFGPFTSFDNGLDPGNNDRTTLAVDDLDGDGHLDVVVSVQEAVSPFEIRPFAVLLGDGQGGFGPPTVTPTQTRTVTLDTGDFNEDGNPDVVVIDRDGPGEIHFGDGTGAFPASRPFPDSGQARALCLADVNGDDHVDVVVTRDEIPGAVIYLGDGQGGLVRSTALRSLPLPDTVVVADLTGDGHPEVIVVGESERRTLETAVISIFIADGEGGFLPHRTDVAPPAEVGRDLDQLVAADFDRDGQTDLAVARGFILRNRTLDPLRSRRGNVNGAVGPLTDVLLVNGSPGDGAERTVAIGACDPFVLRIEQPASNPSGRDRYLVHVWRPPGVLPLAQALPSGIGPICLPTSLTGGAPLPVRTVNRIGFEAQLGSDDWPTNPGLAPTDLVSFAKRPPFQGRFLVQGLIFDSASLQGRVAVTNAVEVVLE